ncbi:putative DNA repair glycosylase MJ1434 [Candidatus Magnetomoraceae bacterium gMMP-15]
MKNTLLLDIYKTLFKVYGPQGWWPLINQKNGESMIYHPGDYSLPETDNQRFEICIGAILTQNTGWSNVEKALINLKRLNSLNSYAMQKIDINTLKKAIRPSGYFKQKALKLKKFTEFYLFMKDRIPSRKNLLSVWGIGPETADSMLLYAYKVPTFIIDTYTKRIFYNLGLIDKNFNYDKIKHFFENNLKLDLIIFQEYHALIIKHAKQFYNKKINYYNDSLLKSYTVPY